MPAKKNIDPNKSVAALYPLLILEWHPTKNSELKWTLWEVTHGSRKEDMVALSRVWLRMGTRDKVQVGRQNGLPQLCNKKKAEK